MKNNTRIAVSGASGQLGKSLARRSDMLPQATWDFTDVEELDITQTSALQAYFKEYRPGIFINCAAYTAVDNAETDKEAANTLNHLAPGQIAALCADYRCRLIHISTDYVFDGSGNIPLKETNPVEPAGVYGSTKLDGENAVQSICPDSLIIRTSWLYSEYGKNFLKTMLRLGKDRSELKVVFDQTGSPTYAGHLAEGILEVCRNLIQKSLWHPGIYHFSNEGVCSWYDFAREIMQKAELDCTLTPVESHEFPQAAKRPNYSVLNKAKFRKSVQYHIPHWTEGLEECLKHMEE